MVDKRVSETELLLPALYFINREPGITTSRLKSLLVDLLRPTGKDAEIAKNRSDTYFEQKVRNLVSHRTLQERGYAEYRKVGRDGVHTVTEAGRAFLRTNIDALEYLFSGDFNYNDVQSSFVDLTKIGEQKQRILIYGEKGRGYIEIHHQKPIFQYEEQDTAKFLEQALQNVVPVRSNCHRMIHREKNAPMPVEELRQIVEQVRIHSSLHGR